MFEVNSLRVSEWAAQHHHELLCAGGKQRLFRQKRLGRKRWPGLIQLATHWLDEWIVYMGAQVQDNPDMLYPYFWGGPMASYYTSRCRRFL